MSTTEAKNDGGPVRRAFVHFNRAWYAEAARAGQRWSDEINIRHYYGPQGKGYRGDMAIAFYPLPSGLAARLEVFDDAWGILGESPDLVRALAEIEGTSPSPLRVCELLEGLGYIDETPTERR